VRDATVEETVTAAPAAPRPGLLPRGTVVGRYVVIAPVGAGGMGVVYRAFDPELDRHVALKLIRSRDGSDNARASLLREAQALAKLSHPNVVAVHDVGTFDDQVFIAMELLHGATLRAWMTAERSWRDIVRAFIEAGRGLAAAHRAGLVHRDFKPSNAFVETSGRVRLLDFGLARRAEDVAPGAPLALPGADADDAGTMQARGGRFAGTPAYMAPEQRAGDATPQSDQYALCVALCEALYQRAPVPNQSERELRGPGPARLRAIVARGLRSDPAARFPTMDALTEALEDTVARRSYAALAAGIGLAAVTAVALVSRGLGPEPRARCQRADDAVAEVWTPAAADAVRAAFAATDRPYAADTAGRVVAGIDGYASAWGRARRDACEATWVRGEQSAELLDERMACLDRRLAALRAYTGIVTAGVTPSLVDRAVVGLPTIGDLERCASRDALAAGGPGPAAAARFEVARLQARLEDVGSLRFAARHAEAERVAREVLAAARGVGYRPLIAEAVFYLGTVHQSAGDAAAARARLDEAIQLAAEAHHLEILARASALQVYVVGDLLGKADEAIGLATGARAHARLAGNPPRAVAALGNNLGNVYFNQGRYADARREYTATLAIELEYLGPQHLDVAWSWSNLGRIFLAEGDAANARGYFESAVAIAGRALGDRHPDVAPFLNNLSRALLDLGDTAGALAQVDRGLAVLASSGGQQPWRAAELLLSRGLILAREQRWAEALADCGAALAINQSEFDPMHLAVGRDLACRGAALVGLGQFAAAVPVLDRAVAVIRATSRDPVEAAAAEVPLAEALWRTGAQRRAVAVASTARDAYAAIPGRAVQLAEIRAWLAAHP
jgi:eukaryotic-like serine/threonine-protein kinase